MTGKIFVIEGVDSVGKYTQTLELEKKLQNDGYKVYHHSFPTYDEEQSTLAKMFLQGKFGEDVNCLNYKIVSSFFAVDRIATYYLSLKEKIDAGYIVILDRYTTSNMVHQASKCHDNDGIIAAANWIDNYEFNDLGLPRPNAVIYLTIDQKIREHLLDKRRSDEEKDIDEKDKDYLKKCSEIGLMIAKHYDWHIVDCSNSSSIKSVDEISTIVYNIVKKELENR